MLNSALGVPPLSNCLPVGYLPGTTALENAESGVLWKKWNHELGIGNGDLKKPIAAGEEVEYIRVSYFVLAACRCAAPGRERSDNGRVLT